MPISRKPPRYLKYFDAVLEDQPLTPLPQELHTCGDCGNALETCHALIAGKKGLRRGVAAVVLVHCSECSAVHLTQLFADGKHGQGLDTSLLNQIARDLGLGTPTGRRFGARPLP